MCDGSPYLQIYKSRYIIIKVILPKLMLVNGQHGFWKGPVLKSMAEVSYLARFGLVQDARTAGLFFFNPPKQCPVYSGKLFKKNKILALCVAIPAHQKNDSLLWVGFFTLSCSAPLYHGAGAGLP